MGLIRTGCINARRAFAVILVLIAALLAMCPANLPAQSAER